MTNNEYAKPFTVLRLGLATTMATFTSAVYLTC